MCLQFRDRINNLEREKESIIKNSKSLEVAKDKIEAEIIQEPMIFNQFEDEINELEREKVSDLENLNNIEANKREESKFQEEIAAQGIHIDLPFIT